MSQSHTRPHPAWDGASTRQACTPRAAWTVFHHLLPCKGTKRPQLHQHDTSTFCHSFQSPVFLSQSRFLSAPPWASRSPSARASGIHRGCPGCHSPAHNSLLPSPDLLFPCCGNTGQSVLHVGSHQRVLQGCRFHVGRKPEHSKAAGPTQPLSHGKRLKSLWVRSWDPNGRKSQGEFTLRQPSRSTPRPRSLAAQTAPAGTQRTCSSLQAALPAQLSPAATALGNTPVPHIFSHLRKGEEVKLQNNFKT